MNRTETEAATAATRESDRRIMKGGRTGSLQATRVSVSSMTNKWPERRCDEIHSQ